MHGNQHVRLLLYSTYAKKKRKKRKKTGTGFNRKGDNRSDFVIIIILEKHIEPVCISYRNTLAVHSFLNSLLRKSR